MKKLIYLPFIILIFSCSQTAKDQNQLSPNNDSLSLANISAGLNFDERTFKELKLPFIIDTTFIMNVDTTDRISYQNLRSLKALMFEHKISGGSGYSIDTFCKIDSLKSCDKYQSYIDSLDIGMTKNSIAFKIGYISLRNGYKLFLWGITYSSYEACPWFNGTTIIATITNNKKENMNCLIGELSAGGDPPVSGSTQTTCKINEDGSILLNRIQEDDDMDIPGTNVSKEELLVRIIETKLDTVNYQKKVISSEHN